MLFHSLFLTSCISLALAAPRPNPDEENANLEARQLTYSFPGINFGYVTQECNPDQQAILREVALSTQDFMSYAQYGWERGWAWSQYFLDVNPYGPNKGNGWKHNKENVDLYGNIRNSITQARLWATTGHKSGRHVELKQISYRCEEEHLSKCTDSEFGVGAYTSAPQRTGKGWQITFCPTFFKKRYASDIVKAGRTTAVNKLVSFEHLM